MAKGKKRVAAPVVEESEDEHSGSESEDGPGRKRRRGARGRTADRRGADHLVSSFFQGHGTAGNGSGRTLADLPLGGLGAEAGADDGGAGLRELLADLPERHPAAKALLRTRQHEQFGRWWQQLAAGENLLFYGFGSKHDLLQRFAREQLAQGDAACLAVNGLVAGLTAKQVLQWAVAAVKQSKAVHYKGCSTDDMLDLLRRDDRRLYLLLSNIDGPGLRSNESQRLLSELAGLPTVHLAASVDNVNAALLWDLQTRDRFSWVWHNVTNYAPYLREVRFADISSMLERTEQCSKQSATVVLASLSHSAREVFKLIAQAQLDAVDDKGVTFQRLFQQCRERFLVSNEMLLKTFLTEFKDHELLATRRGNDGTDLLHVPLGEEVLEQVLTDVEAMS